MKLRYKILVGATALIGVAVVALSQVLSYTAPCGMAPMLAANTTSMQAVVYRCYGPPEVLEVETLAKPTPKDDEVLVKVRAAGLNPLDWHFMRGEPYFLRQSNGIGAPTSPRIGVDLSGVVEAVGKDVTRFKVGDEVYGGKLGALAEYVVMKQDVVSKPANVSFEQAAGVPIAAVTALQGLRDQGQLRPGQKVLINGASGGVGTFAVQIAKALGAEVTGVCSTRNVELVRSLGADHIIDYTQQDFTQGAERYDVILNNVANHTLSEYRRVLKDHGKFVIVGGGSRSPWFGMLSLPLKAAIWSNFVDQKLSMFIAEINDKDLEQLNDWMRDGKVKPVIDRQYPLTEIAAAVTYLETGRARGKVIVTLE